MFLRKLIHDFPKIGQRCLQTASTKIPNAELPPSLLKLSPSKRSVGQSIGTPVENNLLQYRFAALNITNGNIIPPSIRPPGLNQQRIEDPEQFRRQDIEVPISTIVNEISEKNLDNLLGFDLPPLEGQNESIEAAVMIEIRRQKMKKHKLKKLRKRMKFEWAKRNQRRELRKEKEFQATLLNQIREAEHFSAEAYVNEKLAKVKSLPKWKPEQVKIF